VNCSDHLFSMLSGKGHAWKVKPNPMTGGVQDPPSFITTLSKTGPMILILRSILSLDYLPCALQKTLSMSATMKSYNGFVLKRENRPAANRSRLEAGLTTAMTMTEKAMRKLVRSSP
jgi:hypothetical protein